ncbi:hypothetical protein ACJJIG_17355 [Microbulbifer sp. SSSA007]|uniref:hypothetical protein n=1 Tax=Microbulbifer sp. SSSA007 TaxID=3243379 RepID=UPI004039DA3F
MCFSKDSKYLKDGRLEDVLALLQVLALDQKSHRSESGLKDELSDKPKSAETWLTLAQEHQEFFRVVKSKKFPVSLVLRHISDPDKNTRPPLSPEQAQSLLSTAIELHDRQLKRSQRWTVLIPIWVAVLGALVTLFKVWCSNGS